MICAKLTSLLNEQLLFVGFEVYVAPVSIAHGHSVLQCFHCSESQAVM